MNLEELIIDEHIDQVLALNTGFEVIVWNKACEVATGVKKNSIMGKSVFTLFPEMKQDKAVIEALHAALNGNRSFVSYDPAAQDVYIEKHFLPLKDATGKVIAILNVIHDVAHRIKAEQAIESLNNELTVKNRQLESLHSELKTFTNIAVTNYSETLRQLYLHFEYITAHEAGKLSDIGKANIRKAQAAVQKMKLLTNDIISFTRLNEFDTTIRSIDLNNVLKTVADDLKENIEATNTKLVAEAMPSIQGYPFLVLLIFHHLIDNAIKFRNNKTAPVIEISAGSTVKGAEIKHPDAQQKATYNVITVKDNGIGFEGHDVENIFQIFTRLHPSGYKGSGIGLAICKKAMELHHGFITAEGVPGAGATFRCYFPIVSIAPPYPLA